MPTCPLKTCPTETKLHVQDHRSKSCKSTETGRKTSASTYCSTKPLRLISDRTYFVTIVKFYFGVMTDLETVSFVINSAFS